METIINKLIFASRTDDTSKNGKCDKVSELEEVIDLLNNEIKLINIEIIDGLLSRYSST